MEERRLQFDLSIAVAALVLSAIASIASVYQAHVISQEFSATVWPYVSVDLNWGASRMALDLTNNGLGPAIIRSATLTVDGKKAPSWRAFLADIFPKSVPYGKSATTFFTSVSPGDVIRSGNADKVLRLKGSSGLPAAIVANATRDHAALAVCYCSLLGTCWMKTWSLSENSEPRKIRSCPAASAIGTS